MIHFLYTFINQSKHTHISYNKNRLTFPFAYAASRREYTGRLLHAVRKYNFSNFLDHWPGKYEFTDDSSKAEHGVEA